MPSILSGRSIAAVVDGHCSTTKPINSGVPQGSVLSPTLFLLFINDLSLRNCPIHSYADDVGLCTIPRPFTDILIYRNFRYLGTMLQNA